MNHRINHSTFCTKIGLLLVFMCCPIDYSAAAYGAPRQSSASTKDPRFIFVTISKASSVGAAKRVCGMTLTEGSCKDLILYRILLLLCSDDKRAFSNSQCYKDGTQNHGGCTHYGNCAQCRILEYLDEQLEQSPETTKAAIVNIKRLYRYGDLPTEPNHIRLDMKIIDSIVSAKKFSDISRKICGPGTFTPTLRSQSGVLCGYKLYANLAMLLCLKANYQDFRSSQCYRRILSNICPSYTYEPSKYIENIKSIQEKIYGESGLYQQLKNKPGYDIGISP